MNTAMLNGMRFVASQMMDRESVATRIEVSDFENGDCKGFVVTTIQPGSTFRQFLAGIGGAMEMAEMESRKHGDAPIFRLA
jgi:hypothetical protein